MKHSLLLLLTASSLLFSCKKDKTPDPVPVPAPTISAISPVSGPKNTVVTITGTNFGTSTSALKVYFNNVQGTILTATDVQLTAQVPAGAVTGTVKVEKNSVQVTGPVFTYEGNGFTSTWNLTGAASTLAKPSGITKDASGNFYVCDRDNNRIIKITPAGVTSVLAGSGSVGFTDGASTAAQFNNPYCITIDGAGNLYVGDRLNYSIRKITPAGVVSTLAGNGTAGMLNGTGSAARFTETLGITIDGAGNLYVADYNSNLIRKVTSAGVVTTVTSVPGIFGIVSDAAGNLYFTEYGANRVSKYTTTGTYSVIAGDTGGSAGTTDGTGSAARFNFPAGILLDASGNLYVTETQNNRIRKVTPAGVVTTVAGSTAGYTDGASALFSSPIALTGDFTNSLLYVADFNNNKIRKIIID